MKKSTQQPLHKGGGQERAGQQHEQKPREEVSSSPPLQPSQAGQQQAASQGSDEAEGDRPPCCNVHPNATAGGTDEEAGAPSDDNRWIVFSPLNCPIVREWLITRSIWPSTC